MSTPFGAMAATPPGVADVLGGFCQEEPPAGGHTLEGFDRRIAALAQEQERHVASGDGRGVFHLTYLAFSRQVRRGFDLGRFTDVAFATDMSCRFIDAYLLQARRWAEGDPTQCTAWRRAFDGASSGEANVLQAMFLGMNAHIHYDLAFVTLGSCRAAGDLDAGRRDALSLAGVPDVRHLDFLVINQIAWDAIPTITEAVLGQFAPAMRLGNRLVAPVTQQMGQRLLMDARDTAWRHATLLVHATDPLQRAAIAGVIEAYSASHTELVRAMSLNPLDIAGGLGRWADRGDEGEWADRVPMPDQTRDQLIALAVASPVVGHLALREVAFAGHDPARVLDALVDAGREDLAAAFLRIARERSPRHRRDELRGWLEGATDRRLSVVEDAVALPGTMSAAGVPDLPRRTRRRLTRRWGAALADDARCLAVPGVAAVPELAAALRDHGHRVADLAARLGVDVDADAVGGPPLTDHQARAVLAVHPDEWVRTCAARLDTTRGDRPVDQLIDRVLFLRSTRLFSEVATADLLRVAEHLQPCDVEAGEVLVAEGAHAEGIHLIVEGRVHVSQTRQRGMVPLFAFGRGESVGELAALTDSPSAVECRADTAVRSWLLPTEVLSRLLHHHPRVAVGLLRMLSQRLVLTTQMVASDPASRPDRA